MYWIEKYIKLINELWKYLDIMTAELLRLRANYLLLMFEVTFHSCSRIIQCNNSHGARCNLIHNLKASLRRSMLPIPNFPRTLLLLL